MFDFPCLIWHQTFDPNDWIPTDNGEFPKYSQSKNHLKKKTFYKLLVELNLMWKF